MTHNGIRAASRFRWMGIRALFFAFMMTGLSGAGHGNDEPVTIRQIGGERYRLRLEFADNFDTLDHWLVETSGTVSLKDNSLCWDCFSGGKQAGTIWCTTKFTSPSVVEYDAIGISGARNLNFILYANHSEGLLESTKSRSGEYGEYHQFSNYIVTYLTPRVEGESDIFSDNQWRTRFRKNPGFHLLTERIVESTQPAGRKQRLTYVMESNGQMKFYADGQLMLEFQDRDAPLRSGYHGFRTWNSDVQFADFRVYSILDE